MKKSLNGNDWIIQGYMQNEFNRGLISETGEDTTCKIGPYHATVPGSVHRDIFNAGIIPDRNYGLNFMYSEWLEHRQWVYIKHFSVDEGYDKYLLHLDGLDYTGKIIINNQTVYTFESNHLTHCIDITKYVNLENINTLFVVFNEAPHVMGQIGFTSREKHLKSRYNYCWDWCPRLVNTGIWRDVYIEQYNKAHITDFFPDYTEKDGEFSAEFEINTEALCSGIYSFNIEISDQNGNTFTTAEQKTVLNCCKNTDKVSFKIGKPDLWYPNGYGEQPIYTASVKLIKDEVILDTCQKQIGFKTVKFVCPPTTVKYTLPYTPVINGREIFLKGVNWVPYVPFYGECTQEELEKQLLLFKKMNITVIRVWGGAVLESDAFYNLCDKFGIIVWQEFPQSSSGIDNTTCEEYEFVDKLVEVAKTDILLRRHHVSLLYWCGGNELYTVDGTPLDCKYSYNLTKLKECCNKYDPKKLFVPTSPFGCNNAYNSHIPGENADIHGPWDYYGPFNHYAHWNENNAVLTSETGVPAPPRYKILEKYKGNFEISPPNNSNPYWQNRGHWWIRDTQLSEYFGQFDWDNQTEEYVRLFRWMQAEGIRYTVESKYHYFNNNSGVIIWMANEPFPNNSNTSLIEYDSTPKPAYYTVKKAFDTTGISAKYNSVAVKHGEKFISDIYFRSYGVKQEKIKVEIFNSKGEIVLTENAEISLKDYCEKVLSIEFLPEMNNEVYIMRCSAENSKKNYEIIFCSCGDTPLSALRKIDKSTLSVNKISNKKYSIKNTSDVIAIGVFVCGECDSDVGIDCDNGYFNLLPGEEKEIKFSSECENLYLEKVN